MSALVFLYTTLAGLIGGFGGQYFYGKINTDPQPVYTVPAPVQRSEIPNYSSVLELGVGKPVELWRN